MVYNEGCMKPVETTQDIPLAQWEDGTIQVKDSRVTLDSVVRQFKLGETAEQIQHSFPSLGLREVHGAVYYCLENTDSVEEYLRHHDQAVEEGQRFLESHFDTRGLRGKILTRRSQLLRK
jgi:uncharacterized protein (DUF433 family)